MIRFLANLFVAYAAERLVIRPPEKSWLESSADKISYHVSYMLWAENLQNDILEFIPRSLKVIEKHCEREPPYVVLLGLYGVRGARIPQQRDVWPSLWRTVEIDCDELALPPVVLESGAEDLATVLRPLFDVIWQSGGYASSP